MIRSKTIKTYKRPNKPTEKISKCLRDKWVSQYGDRYSIREYLESDSTSYTHLQIKRAIANDISSFLVINNVVPAPLNIETFIDLLEPVIDERDYIGELYDSEAMDIDTEDYLGCQGLQQIECMNMRKEKQNSMDGKELKDVTLTDIHAQWLLMRSQVISFDEWRKDMLAWARWYKAQKERPMSNIDRQATEDKAS